MSVDSTIRIGELSRLTGISLSVLRSYEKLGLIYADRSQGCHLRFPQKAIEEARQIELLLAQNLTVEEVKSLAGWDYNLHRNVTNPLSIAELSNETGLPISTLRNYVSQGLLAYSQVHTRNWEFPQDAIEQVRRILYLQSLDLPLTEIKQFVEWATLPTAFDSGSRQAVLSRLKKIQAQKAILEDLEQRALGWLSKTGSGNQRTEYFEKKNHHESHEEHSR